MKRRLRVAVAALLISAGLVVPAQPAHATHDSSVRAVLHTYRDIYYTGSNWWQIVYNQGDCDSYGYRFRLSGSGISSMRASTTSPRCNYVVLWRVDPVTGAQTLCYGGGWLPLPYVGAGCNDKILIARVRYASRIDTAGGV